MPSATNIGELPPDATSTALLAAQTQSQGQIADSVIAQGDAEHCVWRLLNGATLMRPADYVRLLDQFVDRNPQAAALLASRRKRSPNDLRAQLRKQHLATTLAAASTVGLVKEPK